MAYRDPTNTENLKRQAIVIPATNEWQAVPSVVPARFNSTSEPIHTSIVLPELDSSTELKCSSDFFSPKVV